MSVSVIRIDNLRCIVHAEIKTHPKFNLLYGLNGSGKTSALEAIYLLGLARSFRSSRIKRVIAEETEQCSVFAKLLDKNNQEKTLGISKNNNGNTQIRLNRSPVKNASQLARILPIQIITQESFSLIDGPSKPRKQLLDWLGFHVEHQFNNTWLTVQRLLKQRNALLRQLTDSPACRNEIAVWDNELSIQGEKLSVYRQNIFDEFKVNFQAVINKLLPHENIELNFYQGWPADKSLADVLCASFERDVKLGYTQLSPNRADLVIKSGKVPASEKLSRGQKKLLVCAIILAQVVTLNERDETDSRCIVLLDDLNAELDKDNQRLLCNILNDCDAQVFITGTDSSALKEALPNNDCNMFHVEQGSITPL